MTRATSPPPACTATALDHAVRACPFLHAVAAKEGVEYARRIAADPARPASSAATRPPVAGEPGTGAAFVATYRDFHLGEGAIVPLVGRAGGGCPFAAAAQAAAAAAGADGAPAPAPVREFTMTAAASGRARVCPAHVHVTEVGASAASTRPAECPETGTAARGDERNGALIPVWRGPPLSAAPFASISLPFLGGLPDPADFFRRRRRLEQAKKQAAQGDPPKPRPGAGPGGSGSSGGRPAVARATRPGGPSPAAPPPRPPRAPRAGPPKPHAATTTGPAPPAPAASTGGGGSGGGGCPLRTLPVLGALLPLAANGGGLACPPAILALRAAVARVPAVRSLRPRPLLTRGLAVTAVGAAAAAPFGAWRVHLDKFSPGWFLAVHATVPFVAALRQATAMPRWALVLTIAGSVAGQLAGARLERARLAARAAAEETEARRQRPRRRLLLPLPSALPALGRRRACREGKGGGARRATTAVVVA